VPNRRLKTGTGRGRGAWPVLGVLLAGVLVPTACVLWFMSAAMRNERLAVRQRLTDVYREHAAEVRTSLEDYWSAKAAALDAASKTSGPQIFAALIQAGVADSAIVYDAAGKRAYPDLEHPPPRPQDEGKPQWQEAERFEYDLAQPGKAAEAYATIAQQAKGPTLKARALQAQARCLLKAGQGDKALAVLTVPLAAAELRDAADPQGRLVVPNAQLLALELMAGRNGPKFRALADKLAERLNDYGGPAMSSAQRRFLMQALGRIDPQTPAFATLAGEELAAEYLETPHEPAKTIHLREAGARGLWHVASGDKRIVAIFREDRLAADLQAAAGLAQPFAGATFRLVRPQAGPASRQEAFLSVPAADQLPGWELQVHIAEESPFAAAAGRQRAVYLWTGVLGIGVITVLALVVAGYIGRQMRLTRLKNDLIATVSHELKTPLASMRVLVDTLLDGRCQDSQQAQEYFQLIAKENERLSRLIDNFLTFSRMERNKKAFEFGEVNVNEVVATAVDCARDRLEAAKCRLEMDAPQDLATVNADGDALVTVVLNLLDNACKYSGDRKRIKLRTYSTDESVCVEVSDNGIGMSRRVAKKIFNRFYQVDQTLSRAAGGCGLGLSIVKFIVDAHGGTIDVTSRPGEGSTFTVRLPVVNPIHVAES